MRWVVAFLFADLIVLPLLDIYRKYYGWKVSAFLFVTFYIATVGAALAVEFAFSALHLIPQQRSARVMQETIAWNYTTWLNIGFLMLALLLVWRFLRTGGPEMLRMMSGGRHGEDPKHHGAESVAHGEGSGPGKFDGASADPIRTRRP